MSVELQFPPGVAYIDGDYRPMSEAKISVLDWGFLRSDATYDVVHVWRQRFFRLDKHLDRFSNSVDQLQMTLPFDRDGLTGVLMECVRRSGHDDAYVEMICTRGVSPTFSRDPRDAVNTFIAFAIPFGWVANEEQRARGLNLSISDIPRISPQSVDPTVKNYHWLDFISGLYGAYENNAENVVLVDLDGNITEGPGFNLFAVKDGRAVTPKNGVLEGITRMTALELCGELNVEAVTETLTVEAVRGADEVFITSTAGGIMSVSKIDGAPVGDGEIGPVTQRLTSLYWEKHTDPNWSTPVD
ncbi:MAG: branched-chain amino acid transferase [Rhodospirillaceae bacterium]|nr:branched-chain amino acid transferase [Rhodospirillaceae bacterium]|tara:strand:- start:674 stop:1573 length:900 start_codon:yes stop_codon:yes gene_type:complete